MKRVTLLVSALVVCLLASSVSAQQVQYVTVSPLSSKIKGRFQPWRAGAKTQIGGLTWGGDVATIDAIEQGYFREEGIDVSFLLENDPAKQAQLWVDGKLPMFRGSLTQACLAAEAMVNAGGKPAVFLQLTFSEGGDRLVWSVDFKQLKDIKGAPGVMQLYAPHTEMLLKAWKDAKISVRDMPIRFVQEITIPPFDTKGKLIDPYSALLVDRSNKWGMLISPDADNITKRSAEGRGDIRPGLSSAEANRVIADVWIVEESVFNANQKWFYAYARAFLRAQEHVEELKASKGPVYDALVKKSAGLLFGDETMAAGVEGLLLDCRQMGFVGNLAFLTGQGTKRHAAALIEEYQPLLVEIGFMAKTVPLGVLKLDFNQLKKGLKFVEEPMTPEIEYDPLAVQRYVEGRIRESASFADDPNTKFQVEIYFGVDQYEFDEAQYGKDFDAFIEIAQSYGGLQMVVIGYADPGEVNKLIRAGKPEAEIERAKRYFKSLSLRRAKTIIDATIARAKKAGITLAEEQFTAVGMGVDEPKFAVPKTVDEWNQIRRVKLTAQAISETQMFDPNNYAQ